MPVRKRQWYPGAIYHVINRGIRKTPIFLCEEDYNKFYSILDDAFLYSPYALHAYCLMTNHYHLLIQTKEQPLAKLMHAINTPYAIWFNQKYKLTGPLFQNRYSSHPVPSDYGLMTVSAYIHNNPREANICEDPSKYRHSSCSQYVTPDLIADQNSIFTGTAMEEYPSLSLEKNLSLPTENLFYFQANPSDWNRFLTADFTPRSPPKAFSKDRIRQLFPVPLHQHYSRYIEREWKLKQIQKSNQRLKEN
ncbi:REP element-mobilizing transposase RayT [Evansella vedderi]|uniref:REP element-mobilizing transposase RayT n=1 Tax=Evansella vedderi TaxID=38282 RepID=A0ABT9ZTI5_9BACI|nr:transposase [Evansella vedderi]MDQ0254549.1 REP element-mobilizing transposase RayT [Evansella vedderi]